MMPLLRIWNVNASYNRLWYFAHNLILLLIHWSASLRLFDIYDEQLIWLNWLVNQVQGWKFKKKMAIEKWKWLFDTTWNFKCASEWEKNNNFCSSSFFSLFMQICACYMCLAVHFGLILAIFCSFFFFLNMKLSVVYGTTVRNDEIEYTALIALESWSAWNGFNFMRCWLFSSAQFFLFFKSAVCGVGANDNDDASTTHNKFDNDNENVHWTYCVLQFFLFVCLFVCATFATHQFMSLFTTRLYENACDHFNHSHQLNKCGLIFLLSRLFKSLKLQLVYGCYFAGALFSTS